MYVLVYILISIAEASSYMAVKCAHISPLGNNRVHIKLLLVLLKHHWMLFLLRKRHWGKSQIPLSAFSMNDGANVGPGEVPCLIRTLDLITQTVLSAGWIILSVFFIGNYLS